MSKKDKLPFLLQNKKARHNYQIVETLEGGLALTGSEVKSLRGKLGSILEAFFVFKKSELYMQNAHIPEYTNGGYANHAPLRLRKVLLHRVELDKLFSQIKEKGYTLVPLKIYSKGRNIKILIGLGRGKTKGDKRQALREKADKKSINRYL